MADPASFQAIPGTAQPALKPSPLEDAFKVLSGYIGGQAQVRQKESEYTHEMLKAAITSGSVGVDFSGGISNPKYTQTPLNEQPDYLKSKASILSALALNPSAQAEYLKQSGIIPGYDPTAALAAGETSGGGLTLKGYQSWWAGLSELEKRPYIEAARTDPASLKKNFRKLHPNEADAMVKTIMGQ